MNLRYLKVLILLSLIVSTSSVQAQTKRAGTPKNPIDSNRRILEAQSDDDDFTPQWSFGFGLGGYSAGGRSVFTLSGDVRYRWLEWTETSSGIDLNFGSETFVGARVGERFYMPLSSSFVPFVYAGYRIFEIPELKSSAWDLGVGFQILQGRGSSFDVALHYLWRTPFDDSATNFTVLGASSTFRF